MQTATTFGFTFPFWNSWGRLTDNDRRCKTQDGGEIIVIKLDQGGYEVRTYTERKDGTFPASSELSARSIAEIQIHAKGGVR